MTQGSLPRSFKAIRFGRLAVDPVDRRPSKINESWPRTQGNLPRSFKTIRLARGQIFDERRRGSSSVGDAQKSITHGYIDPYDRRKPPKKFQGNPCRSPDGRPGGSSSIKNQ
ncbi:uncharacterized protein G2W53_027071 [Senna tora]|uniref:Uncharacterized protein n=1 Tax=Senna tora TaxID=362788 RepID=A0A834WJE2_9FABA|nr:uncharacterized protein G2W53_027071 [Senna tora]